MYIYTPWVVFLNDITETILYNCLGVLYIFIRSIKFNISYNFSLTDAICMECFNSQFH